MAQNFRVINLILSGTNITGLFYPLSNNPSGYATLTGINYYSGNSYSVGDEIVTGSISGLNFSGTNFFIGTNAVVTNNQTGTFANNSFYRAGQLSLGSNVRSGFAHFTSNLPSTGYAAVATMTTGYLNGTSTEAVFVSGKTISGFGIVIGTALASANTSIDYIATMLN